VFGDWTKSRGAAWTTLVGATCIAIAITGVPAPVLADPPPPPPTQISFGVQPGDGTPGGNLATQPVVYLKDAGDDPVDGVSVALTLKIVKPLDQPSPPALSCTTNPVTSANSGQGTFAGCKVTRGGLYKLTATDSAHGLTVDSNEFFVSGAAQLAFTAQPQSSPAGAVWSAQPQVTVQDAHGTTVSTTHEIGLVAQPPGSSSAGWSPLPCTTNPVAATAGVAQFAGCKIDAAGTGYTLYALDKVDNLIFASNTFNVTTGTVSSIAFTRQPAGAPGGQNLLSQPIVTAKDAGGNPVTSFTGAVSLAITSGTGTSGAALGCTSNSVNAVAGVATFAGCDVDKAGSGYTLTATASSISKTATSTSFAITSGTATGASFFHQPGDAHGGAAFGTQPAVRLTDAGGNPVDGTVSLAIKPTTGTSGALLACTANPLATTNGVATFAGCAIDKNGTSYQLVATSGGLTVDSAAFDVTSGTAAALQFASTPPSGTGGTTFGTQPAVHVLDGGGNSASGSVTLSIASGTGTPGAGLDCTAGTVASSGGTATFAGCRIDKAGAGYRLKATLAGNSAITVTSAPFDVAVGTPARLTFRGQPGGGTGGAAWTGQPVVAIEDAGGNIVSAASATIHLAVTNGTGDGTLDCQDDAVPTQLGVAHFKACSIDATASAYTLTATATVGGNALSKVSDEFAVTVGDPASLRFTTQPDGAVAGGAFATQPVVAVLDAGGNVVTSASSTISLSIADGTGSSGAALACAAIAAASGVASFSGCSIDRAGGGYALTATGGGLTRESRPFSVLVPPPAPLGLAPVGVPAAQTYGGRAYADNPTSTEDDVNSATGSLAFTSTDLRVSGVGMPLVFERTYNSADATGGMFGRGWTSVLDISVKVVPGQTMTVRGEDGQQLVWTWNTVTNGWVAPPGAHVQLTCGAKTCKLIRDDGVRWDVNLTANGTRQITDYLAPDLLGLKFAWQANKVVITVGGGTNPTIVNAAISAAGRVTSLTTPTRSVSYAYSAGGLLTGVNDVRGKTWGYYYDGGNRLATLTDPLGRSRLVVTYAGSGRVSALRAPNDFRRIDDTFAWDAGTQTATRSALTNVLGSEQREDYVDTYLGNVLVSQTLPTGGVTRYSYDSKVHLIESQNALGWVTTYAYDNAGNLVQESSPTSSTQARTVRMGYDGQHRITSQTDPNGNTTTYVYNGPWLGAVKPPATGNTQWLRFDYNSLGELTRTVGPQNQRVFTYDAHGNQTSAKIQTFAAAALNGNGTAFTYDEAGDRTSMKDALNRTTTWAYDSAGHLLSTIPPLGNATLYSYDDSGDLSGSTDPATHTTLWSWNEPTRTRTMTVDGTPRTVQTYDPSGNLLSDLAPTTGRGNTYAYDVAGRNVRLTDAAGVRTSYAFDLVDNLVAADDSVGRTLAQQFDALNRPIRKVANGRVTKLGYDAAGNVVSSTDASGHTTTFGYDVVNAVTSARTPAGTTTYGYDTAGDLTSVTDPGGHATAYLYDAVGRRTKATTGGAATSYTYDNVDNVKTTTDPDGRVTTYTLDALNRPTTTKYSWAGHADVTVGQTYDVLGRRHTMTDSVGTHTYTYDPNGNLTQVATGGDVFSYDYTSTPGKVVETYPDGTPVTYGLDDAQNLMSVQSGTQGSAGYVGVSYLRNALRDTAGIAFSNGVLETRQTDVAGDVLSQTLTVGGQLAATDEFSYDRGGNPLSQVSTVGGNVTTNRYGYDGNGRLNAFSTSSLAGGTAWPDVSNLDTSNNAAPSSPTTTVAPAFAPLATPAPPAGPGPSQSLTYDGDGNRLSNTTGAGTTGYGYNAKDQLVTRNGADGAATYAYDSSGNLTSRAGSGGTTTYGYDSASRLVRVTLPGGAVVTYTYDGDGNRVSKTAGGQTTQYLWDPANVLPQLALERKASDHSLIRRYVYGDGPVAMQVPDGAGVATYFFHLDPQGSITELTTADGQLAAAYHYDGWGNVTVDGDGHGNPLLFQAEYRDPDTGLYYMRARNYDATTGRFTQKDPKAAPVGAPVMTPYHFAYDHPTSLGDPTGETVNENDVFWSHNNLEANVASDVNLGVGAIKLGIGAYKGVLALGEMLSPKAITATESLGSSVGAEARAVGAGAGEVGSEAGALGKLGGEGAAGAEALEGSGKALKAVGTGLAIAGLALQTYITVEDCIHNTALVCAADVTGLAISLAFTVGCEFVSAGAASVVCAIVGGALAVAIPMLITAYGPQMVAGVMTAYDAVADLAVAGANIVADAVLADVAVLTDVAQTFAGSVVTGYNTAVSALSSGYQTAIGTLVDAGYSALQLAETLATTFTQGVDDAIAALAGFGYDVADVAVAVKDWFGKTAGETAALLKDTYSWTVDQVSAGLTEAYGLAADGLAAALDFAAYAVDEIASGLKSALDATTAELAEILDGLGYGIDQVAAALQDVYDLADQALADLFHDLDSALGYTLDQITGTLQTIYNDADAAAAAALQFASYAAGVIADALKDVYDDVATEVAAILDDLTFTVNEIANAMVDAFALADEVTAQILDNLGKTATQVAAALVDAYEDAVQTITDVLNEVGYGVHEATNALISTFGALADDAADFLDAAGYALLDVANALQDEFLQSASDAIKILDSVTTAAIGAIATAIGAAFALIPDEVAQAFKDAVNYTIDTIAGLLQDTYGYAAQAVADLFTGMGYALDAIKGVLESIYGLADDIIGGLLQLAGWAADLISDLGGAFASFGQDIADAASDAWDTVTSWF
jgi:RHS repeat-associated protein